MVEPLYGWGEEPLIVNQLSNFILRIGGEQARHEEELGSMMVQSHGCNHWLGGS